MARPLKQDRSSVATDTLTLRLSPDDRAMLDRLVAHRAAELADEGIEVTAASFVRGPRGLDAREVRKSRWTAGMAREWRRSHKVPPPPFGPWVRRAGAVRGRLRGRCGGGAGAVVG